MITPAVRATLTINYRYLSGKDDIRLIKRSRIKPDSSHKYTNCSISTYICYTRGRFLDCFSARFAFAIPPSSTPFFLPGRVIVLRV